MRYAKSLIAATIAAGVVSAVSAAEPGSARRPAPATRPIATSDVPLDLFLDQLRDAGLNLAINWPALEAAGVDRGMVINLRLRGVPIRTLLDYALREAGQGRLAWYVSDGVVNITTRELADQAVVTRVFPVQDLVADVPNFEAPMVTLSSGGGGRGGGGGGASLFGGSTANPQTGETREARGEKLCELVRTLIRPEVWQENGGTASIRYFAGNLIVTAPRDVINQIGR